MAHVTRLYTIEEKSSSSNGLELE
ncbi:hypothetical protein CCACVL1_08269 [Corchorus capsularis]|uniref:Uncharacterized protein n=1 Tax=Corchorus capsularis TaxID=210143 RepID=A0A1R3J1E4_COCAP|nr:hypothetical protein CCACVL1_08269 [Corchorus capsularis]